MKFLIKEWERKFNKTNNNYKDLYHHVGVFDIKLSKGDTQGQRIAILKRNGKEKYITGIFSLELNSKYMSFSGFDKNIEGQMKYVQYRCYNL